MHLAKFSSAVSLVLCLSFSNLIYGEAQRSGADEIRLCTWAEYTDRKEIEGQLEQANYQFLELNVALEQIKPLQGKLKFSKNRWVSASTEYAKVRSEILKLTPVANAAWSAWGRFAQKSYYPVQSSYSSQIKRLQDLKTEFKALENRLEYQLNVALRYGNGIAANQIRSEISQTRQDMDSLSSEISLLQSELFQFEASVRRLPVYKNSKKYESVMEVLSAKSKKLEQLKSNYLSAKRSLAIWEKRLASLPKLALIKSKKQTLEARVAEFDAICQGLQTTQD